MAAHHIIDMVEKSSGHLQAVLIGHDFNLDVNQLLLLLHDHIGQFFHRAIDRQFVLDSNERHRIEKPVEVPLLSQLLLKRVNVVDINGEDRGDVDHLIPALVIPDRVGIAMSYTNSIIWSVAYKPIDFFRICFEKQQD